MKIQSLIFTIVIATSLLSGTTLMSYGATNPIPSPREQMDNGISTANVVCKAGLTLIVRANSDTAACVSKQSSEKLIQNGWAIKLSALLEKKPSLSNIGDVKTIKIVPIFFDKKRLDTKEDIVTSYNYVFEACSKSSFIRSPEVLITSDSETKSIKLSESLQPKGCQTSATVIKATNTESIKASMVKKTDLDIIVGTLESKVTMLKEKLDKEKKELVSLVKQTSLTADSKKKISATTDNIINLRNELDTARADLQKNQYSLIVGAKAPPPKVQAPPQTSETQNTGSAVTTNYPYVSKLKVIPEFSDAGRLKSDPIISSYNYVFEACAGTNEILFPIVLIRSDTESKSVKLSEKLDARGCQTSSTVIKAANVNTIQGAIVTNGDISKSINDLESKVSLLKENIAKDKNMLVDLAKQTPLSDDNRKMITELTEKIVNQRNELNQAKHELTSLKYMIIQ